MRHADADATVFSLNDPDIDPDGEAAAGFLLAGVNRATGSRGETLTFSDLADRSHGVSRLGVLRMDVDSLGGIFATGLPQTEVTLSRLTNLSKTLAYFFGGQVSTIVQRADTAWKQRAQIIYAGGDDVFIVGSWSVLPALARHIREAFSRFTCGNPAWGISGGLAVVRAEQPVAAAARVAGELEAAAKTVRPSGRAKDALAFLGEPLPWGDLEVAAAVTAELLAIIGVSCPTVPGFPAAKSVELGLPRGWLHRFGKIAEMYRDAVRDLTRGGRRPLTELDGATRRGRWAWSAAYALARVPGHPHLRERLQALLDQLPGKSWSVPHSAMRSERDLIWLLRPAVLWADLLSRDRNERRE